MKGDTQIINDIFAADEAEILADARLRPWLESLLPYLGSWTRDNRHGDFRRWCGQLEKISDLRSDCCRFGSSIEIGSADEIPSGRQKELRNALMQFQPWRKGPYRLFGIDIDTEWRSDLKWDRLCGEIADLNGRYALDVGCSNGYHMWRMRDAGARQVFGIDPCLHYLFQFLAIRSLAGGPAGIHLFPMVLEQLPHDLPAFDTAFSMGVIYHQKSPFVHLEHLRQLLTPGGQLVLETLVVSGDEKTVLTPEDRYACMGNVWCIPSVKAALLWLRKTGFSNPRLINVSVTGEEEQHRSVWGCTESLADFLDRQNPELTAEGYEAPRRAIFLAEKAG
ncbi:MAG: tRNA 5-methoxyuridine(34)/uridine 5-oxyacetic acid(34) synthase CmoB [Succinivibrionaceae bacterium]|nr:tRNA 5-methoxyuridine(34)/uridine 5-oxyacetic acid(34) synthase CmoB [Succinivibrionaceae bacterium]